MSLKSLKLKPPIRERYEWNNYQFVFGLPKHHSISWPRLFKVKKNGSLYRMKRPMRRLVVRGWIGISPRMCFNRAYSSELTFRTVLKVINKPHLNIGPQNCSCFQMAEKSCKLDATFLDHWPILYTLLRISSKPINFYHWAIIRKEFQIFT